ncbi:hypothetical protein [Haloprofundus salilacus]|uniref:hypothetical protein n=1 Tax=Haloprofundus salilacus TaxID=2876190 RepID=UPI001CCD7CFB|nr:hypothetical protein [Haloprofundus salilacus]
MAIPGKLAEDEFRMAVAEAVGAEQDILKTLGRDWSDSDNVQTRLPTDPNEIGVVDDQGEDDEKLPDFDEFCADQEASA